MLGIPARHVAYVKRATPVWNGETWLSGNYTPPKLPAGGGIGFRCYGWAALTAAEIATVGGGYAYSSPTLYVELYVPPQLRDPLTGEVLADLDALDLIELPEQGPVNEVQRVGVPLTLTDDPWALTFKGQTTDDLAYNVSGFELTHALQLLPSIGPNNVAVTKTRTEYTVEFRGGLAAAPQPLLIATDPLTGQPNAEVGVSRATAGTANGEAFGQYLTTGYKRDNHGLTGWAPGYVLNLQRTTW